MPTKGSEIAIFIRDEAGRRNIPVSHEELMHVGKNPELYAIAIEKGVAFTQWGLAKPHFIKISLAVLARLEKVLSPEHRSRVLRFTGAE